MLGFFEGDPYKSNFVPKDDLIINSLWSLRLFLSRRREGFRGVSSIRPIKTHKTKEKGEFSFLFLRRDVVLLEPASTRLYLEIKQESIMRTTT